MHGYVYLTIQRSTGYRYVGQRRGGFDPDYLGSGRRIVRSIAKHGKEDFEVSFLQAGRDQTELDALEKSYIAELRELYPRELILNIADGGLCTNIDGKPFMTGRRHSEETRRLFSEQRRGERNNMFGVRLVGELNPRFGAVLTDETKRKISAGHAAHRALGIPHGNKGRIKSAETCAKISAGKTGKPGRAGWKMTDEQRAKISAARKALFASGFKCAFTAETRRKISDGRKRYWATKKEATCA